MKILDSKMALKIALAVSAAVLGALFLRFSLAMLTGFGDGEDTVTVTDEQEEMIDASGGDDTILVEDTHEISTVDTRDDGDDSVTVGDDDNGNTPITPGDGGDDTVTATDDLPVPDDDTITVID